MNSSPGTSVSCDYCGKAGHVISKCNKKRREERARSKAEEAKVKLANMPKEEPRKAKAAGEAKRQSGQCWTCGKQGHRSHSCPQKSRVRAFLATLQDAKSSSSKTSTSNVHTFNVDVKCMQSQIMAVETPNGDNNNITRAKVKYYIGDIVCTGIVALDTCCSHDIFAPGHAPIVSSPSKFEATRYGGDAVPLGSEACFTLLRSSGERVNVRGVCSLDASHLPNGCIAMPSLLSRV